MAIEKLSKFPDVQFDQKTIERVLADTRINEVRLYVLGPEGTNISQSSKRWAREIGISQKATYHFCGTPEASVEEAKKVSQQDIFPVFVACAVYYDMNKLFFSNPDCYTLMHHHYMKLDQMQLAAREKVDDIPPGWVIATHPSPKVLLSGLENRIVDSTSNSSAAKLCSDGVVDACITTETARRIYCLETIHDFGSPVMLFTYGTTPHGIKILQQFAGEKK